MGVDTDWKSELEKVTAEQQALKEHYKNAVIRLALENEIRASWTIDADLAAKIIDTSLISFSEETGEVTGAREAVLDLAQRRPHLFTPKIKTAPPPKRGHEELEAIQKEIGIFRKS